MASAPLRQAAPICRPRTWRECRPSRRPPPIFRRPSRSRPCRPAPRRSRSCSTPISFAPLGQHDVRGPPALPGRQRTVPQAVGVGAGVHAGLRRPGAAVQRALLSGLPCEGWARHGAGLRPRSARAQRRRGAVAAACGGAIQRGRAAPAGRGQGAVPARSHLRIAVAELRGGGPAGRRPPGDRIRAGERGAQWRRDRHPDETRLPDRGSGYEPLRPDLHCRRAWRRP